MSVCADTDALISSLPHASSFTSLPVTHEAMGKSGAGRNPTTEASPVGHSSRRCWQFTPRGAIATLRRSPKKLSRGESQYVFGDNPVTEITVETGHSAGPEIKSLESYCSRFTVFEPQRWGLLESCVVSVFLNIL